MEAGIHGPERETTFRAMIRHLTKQAAATSVDSENCDNATQTDACDIGNLLNLCNDAIECKTKLLRMRPMWICRRNANTLASGNGNTNGTSQSPVVPRFTRCAPHERRKASAHHAHAQWRFRLVETGRKELGKYIGSDICCMIIMPVIATPELQHIILLTLAMAHRRPVCSCTRNLPRDAWWSRV